jgi:hypothetical protein
VDTPCLALGASNSCCSLAGLIPSWWKAWQQNLVSTQPNKE